MILNFFRARRQLDAVLIEQNINYLDSLNVQLDVDVKERIESDLIIEKITSTRLDAMQRTLVRQVGPIIIPFPIKGPIPRSGPVLRACTSFP